MAPFLELAVYSHDSDEQSVLVRFVEALLRRDAEWVGVVRLRPDDGPFVSPLSVGYEDVQIGREVLSSPVDGRRLVQVQLRSALRPARSKRLAPDVVTYVGVSAESADRNPHPVALWSDGSDFSFGEVSRRRSRRTGELAYGRFLQVIAEVDPSYGAITVDYGLETPADLARDPRSYAFRDFFVGERYAGSTGLRRIRDLWRGAYVEELPNGLYISSTPEFNPDKREFVDDPGLGKSVETARLIVSWAKRQQAHPPRRARDER